MSESRGPRSRRPTSFKNFENNDRGGQAIKIRRLGARDRMETVETNPSYSADEENIIGDLEQVPGHDPGNDGIGISLLPRDPTGLIRHTGPTLPCAGGAALAPLTELPDALRTELR